MHGVCRFGEHCQFSHDLHDKPNLVCSYYKKGQCAYGKSCRYDHVRDRKDRKAEEPTTSRALKINSDSSFVSHDESWAEAAEFVPGKVYSPRETSSYSGIVKTSEDGGVNGNDGNGSSSNGILSPTRELCPYYVIGDCHYGKDCVYLHGMLCDMCGLRILHPDNVSQQEKHKSECLASHEEDMKASFNVAQSAKVQCGICMEVVWEKKEKRNRKFGILENCNHSFCLECIRKWRSAKSFQNTVVRACPECRISSSFVTPSDNWVTDAEDKKKLIDGYKEHLSKKPCKHFDQGRGQCPFGANCFYLHAYPDGTKQDRAKIPKRVRNVDGRNKMLDPSTLWDFIEDDNFLDFDDDSLDFFDLVYLLGASTSLHGDEDTDSLDLLYSDSDDSDFVF